MKRTLSHPVFVFSISLAIINQLMERVGGIYLPFIHSYLDDILCFPIMLTVGLSVYRLAWPNYRLTHWHIWPLLIVLVLIFEVYLPPTSPKYTRDPWDVLAYTVGIFIFQFTINKEPEIIGTKKAASTS